VFQPDLLKGKRILVTGGGTGLGRSMSHRFLELGANVVICGRREDVLEQTGEELTKETGAEIETVWCDVRLGDEVEAMMDRIWQKRPLDILAPLPSRQSRRWREATLTERRDRWLAEHIQRSSIP
jgi:NAD(P)-dependent dehydrogenase (short-subunit alcohol dehydrogenase family)